MATKKATAKVTITGEGPAVSIKAPNIRSVNLLINGTANYVSNAFGGEAANMMRESMAKGSVDKVRGSKKPPKDFQQGFRDSLHISDKGEYGIPCVAFRAAMVRAAQLCGVEMTKAKMCVFVEAEAYTKDGNALILLRRNGKPAKPEYFEAHVRNSNGSADIRARGRFSPGWEATVKITYDADFLSADSVANLLYRAGVSVGVGAGRPFSTMSVGQGWGTFEVISGDGKSQAAE